MANTSQAWDDYNELIKLVSHVRTSMKDIIRFSKALQTLRTEIMADVPRRNNVAAILAQDPEFDIDSIRAKIDQIGTMATYCVNNRL